jgi:hypothetical protein
LFAGALAANARYASALGPASSRFDGRARDARTIVLIMGPPDEAPKPERSSSRHNLRRITRIGIAPTMFGDGTRTALVPGIVAVVSSDNAR